MYSLLYRSVAATPLSEAEVTALADQAARSNRLRGVTGLLLYSPVASMRGGLFMQWIEGRREDVARLYHHRILHDPRHVACEVLYEGKSEPLTGSDTRVLPSWSMRLVTERLGLFPTSAEGFLKRLPLYTDSSATDLPAAFARRGHHARAQFRGR